MCTFCVCTFCSTFRYFSSLLLCSSLHSAGVLQGQPLVLPSSLCAHCTDGGVGRFCSLVLRHLLAPVADCGGSAGSNAGPSWLAATRLRTPHRVPHVQVESYAALLHCQLHEGSLGILVESEALSTPRQAQCCECMMQCSLPRHHQS